jgi:hypothetical protein
VLLLATDGLEESKRKLRNAAFEPIVCDVEGHSKDSPGGTHDKGDAEGTEDFTNGRVDEVFNAVFSKGRYRLVRSHNPTPDEELEFDFSSCQGTAKEAALAVISVEKVYRMVPDPSAGPDSRVMVDEKLVAFLKAHFLQFDRYFSHPQEKQSVKGYVTFSHAREDDQYDDLTILVIRRK